MLKSKSYNLGSLQHLICRERERERQREREREREGGREREKLNGINSILHLALPSLFSDNSLGQTNGSFKSYFIYEVL